VTGTLWHLLAAMAAFLASHAIPARPGLRARGMRLFGTVGYHLAYSLLSIAVVVWLAYAYADAPHVPLWDQAPWMRWVPLVAMFFAALLLVAGATTPNPFSLGPGRRGFNVGKPGILRFTRHPLLWALVLWAGAHIVPNGEARSLILFLPMLVLALLGPRLMERKRRRDLGDEFELLARHTNRPSWWGLAEIGWKRLLGGVLLYFVLLHLHAPVIGVSPLPL
jgi:uncharacterized membrane protein